MRSPPGLAMLCAMLALVLVLVLALVLVLVLVLVPLQQIEWLQQIEHIGHG